jgi:hypothetical protein
MGVADDGLERLNLARYRISTAPAFALNTMGLLIVIATRGRSAGEHDLTVVASRVDRLAKCVERLRRRSYLDSDVAAVDVDRGRRVVQIAGVARAGPNAAPDNNTALATRHNALRPKRTSMRASS